MAIKAFVFDCGGVLLHRVGSVYQEWESRLGLEAGELESRLWYGDDWRSAEIGQITEDEFWRRSAINLGIADEAQASKLAEDLWTSWAVNAKVLEMIDSMRPRFRVAMLSNASDVLERQLEQRYGVLDRFETVINSAHLGIAKPAEGIYTAMLTRLGVNASEVVFIDDRAENVAAAAALGMHVIWFISAEELGRQLAVYLRNGRDSASDDHAGGNGAGNGDGVDVVAQAAEAVASLAVEMARADDDEWDDDGYDVEDEE